MENDIISLFLTRKKQNVCKYADLFIKYSLKNKVKLNKIINKIVEIYYDKFYLEKNLDFSLLSKYFEIGKNNESVMKDVLLSALLFYKDSGLENQIESDIKTIVILSNAIYLAISLDDYTNEYKNSNVEFENRIENFFTTFESKLKLKSEEIDDIKTEFISVVKKDVTAEKKFWKCLTDNNFNLSFKIDNENHNYFLVDYSYDIKLLKRYDSKEVEKASYTKGIIDDILTIYLEKLAVVVLKDLLSKNINDLFFINIYADYFNKNKDLLALDRILVNDSIRQRIVFCFDIKNTKKDMNVIKYLSSKGYKLGLMLNDEAITSTATTSLFNYVFTTKEVIEKYSEYKELWDIKNVKFITDSNFIDYSEEDIFKEER